MVKAENTVKKISQKNLCSVQHFRSLTCIYGEGQKQSPERAHMKGRFIMKKTISLMLALASISSMGVSAMAANDTGEPMVIAPAPSVVATAQRQFVVNGKAMQLDSYMTENGTLMVPVRALAEALGFKVTWNNGEVNINDGEMQCDLRIGEENYFVYTAIKDAIGMSAPFTLGSAPVLKNDKTYVPVKLFVPLFGNNDAAVQITDTTVTIDKDAESGDFTEIPNPLTKHEDIASLETAIGFKLICPTLPDGYKADSFIDISGEVAEVNYTNGADTVRFRMKKGDEADISGNYNVYAVKKTLTAGDTTVNAEGNESISKATWTKSGFSFSMTSEKGLTDAAVIAAVK